VYNSTYMKCTEYAIYIYVYISYVCVCVCVCVCVLSVSVQNTLQAGTNNNAEDKTLTDKGNFGLKCMNFYKKTFILKFKINYFN
jgi:hypothetical protein